MKFTQYLHKAAAIYQVYGLRGLFHAVSNKIKKLLRIYSQPATLSYPRAQILLCQKELCSHNDFHASAPRITIFVLCTGVFAIYSEETIKSLLNLNYPNFHVVLLVDNPNASSNFHKDFDTVYIPSGTNWKSVLDQHAKTAPEGYFSILQAGDKLTEDSLLLVAQEIFNTSPALIYSDCCTEADESAVASRDWYPAFSLSDGLRGHSLFFSNNVILQYPEINASTVNGLLISFLAAVMTSRIPVKYIQHVLLIAKNSIPIYQQDESAQISVESTVHSYYHAHNANAVVHWHQGKFKTHIQKQAIPLVSIIVYFHSGTKMDFRSIDKLLFDTDYPNLEYIFAVPKKDISTILQASCSHSAKILPCEPSITPAEAFNTAASFAQGEFLTFLYNGVSCSSENWLTSHIDTLETLYADAISPLVIDSFGCIPVSSMPLLDLDEDQHHGDRKYAIECAEFSKNLLQKASVLPRYCLTIRKQAYEEIGRFNASKEAEAYFNIEASLQLTAKNRLILCDGRHSMTVAQNLIDLEKKETASIFAKLLRLHGAQIQDSGMLLYGSNRFFLNREAKNDGLYWPKNPANLDCKKSILLINHELSRTGTPQVVLKASRVLKKAGFFVVAASCSDGPMRDDFLAEGVPVMISHTFAKFRAYPSKYVVPGITPQVDRLLHGFDLTLVASIVGHNFINAFNGSDVKILWWIHDGYTGFEFTKNYLPKNLNSNIHTYCGGIYAQKVLQQFCPEYKSGSLLYGVEDYADKIGANAPQRNDQQLFLIPATFEERKNQLTFVRAVASLPREITEKASYILVGKAVDNAYFKALQKESANIPNFSINNPIPYNELMDLYRKATCIVMPSKDDPMPVVLAEAMMMSKIVICSDMTGTAHYINDGVNGFVFPFSSPQKLAEKIRFVIENCSSLDKLRENARITYEQEFSETAFDNNLTNIITNTLQ